MNINKKLLLSIFALSIVTLGFRSTAFALTITPVRLEIQGDPGQTLTQQMTLMNESKQDVVYYSSYSNFEAQGETGSPTFVNAKDDIGTWMSAPDSVNLAPGQQKIVTVTIAIPKDAEPGGHFGAVFWGNVPNTPSAGGQVSIGSKTGLLVLLSVNGDVKEQAGLVDFKLHNDKHFYKDLPVGFQYRFSNQGGDRVKPSGSVVIRSILGWTVKKVNANEFGGNVLPGTTRRFTPEWSKRDTLDQRDQEKIRNEKYSFTKEVKSEWHNFAVGIYRAKVVATFGANEQTVKSNAVYFAVFPWELILVILIIAIPLYFILRAILHRYNRSVIRKAQARFGNGQ